MTCARIAIVKTTWLLLETKITWQDRWLERERGHITNNVVRMITSCLTTAAGVNNLMSRYFQFIKFHVFWSSWDTLGNKTKLPPRQYFHLGPICFDWLWSVAWGKNWISQLDIAQQSKCESLGNWWLMTDHWSGVHNCLSFTGGQYWTLSLTRTRHPSPTTWAPWPRWHTAVWLWFCVGSWQNEAWVGGCSVLASLDST